MTRPAPGSAASANRWTQLWLGVVCMILIANLQYAWTLFVSPMHQAHGWSLRDIQFAFAIFIATETWLTPLAGWAVDSLGPRRGPPAAIAVGAVLRQAQKGVLRPIAGKASPEAAPLGAEADLGSRLQQGVDGGSAQRDVPHDDDLIHLEERDGYFGLVCLSNDERLAVFVHVRVLLGQVECRHVRFLPLRRLRLSAPPPRRGAVAPPAGDREAPGCNLDIFSSGRWDPVAGRLPGG